MSEAGSRTDAGTTLMEMLAVLAVMTLIAAIVFPSIERGTATFALHETATVVATDMHTARALAIRSGQTVAFAANASGHSYGWTGGPIHVLPNGLSMQEPNSGAIYFYPDGSASAGSVILSSMKAAVSIVVDPAAGNIAMKGAQHA